MYNCVAFNKFGNDDYYYNVKLMHVLGREHVFRQVAIFARGLLLLLLGLLLLLSL